ncbi:MAG: hypothetical protein KAJ19_23140 [Gammaproteobacteria bacterium]|nr:hypothetical protein [Gammaproteobacteria bacterium]
MSFLADLLNKTMTPGSLMVLVMSDEMDLDLRLPEIYVLLGEELMMKFLEIFGGRTINVPPVKRVRQAYKTVAAHMRFEELSKINGEKDALIQTGVELDMEPVQVKKAWAKIKAMLDRLEESVKNVVKEV